MLFLDDRERVVELATGFVEHKSGKLSAKSIPLYARRIRDLCAYLERHEVFSAVRVDVALTQLSLSVIKDFLRDREALGHKSQTLRGYEITIRELCKWLPSAEAGNALSRDPFVSDSWLTAKPISELPALTTVDVVIRLLMHMNFEEHRMVAHFMFDTGLRISEVGRVLKSDIPDPTQYPRSVMYFPLFVRGVKGRQDEVNHRATIISRAMIARINKYHNSSHYIRSARKLVESHQSGVKQAESPAAFLPAFLNTEGKALTQDAIENFIRDAAKRADLHISSHKLRHGTGYSILRSEHGKTMLDNLIILKKALGHKLLSTTEGYTNVPAVALARNALNTHPEDIVFRFEEAQSIFDQTYLASHSQLRKRRGVAS
ncbi:site-specific tyrosine recombinase XerC [Variovorax sp. RA8]|nr:site-specific tyrosine recombinase XerC [Variovorax sp. RA8]